MQEEFQGQCGFCGVYATVAFAFLNYMHHTRPDPITKRISAVPPSKWRDVSYICLPIYLLELSSKPPRGGAGEWECIILDDDGSPMCNLRYTRRRTYICFRAPFSGTIFILTLLRPKYSSHLSSRSRVRDPDSWPLDR